jgi:hypothetical protein
MPAGYHLVHRLKGKSLAHLLDLEINWGETPILVKLGGILDNVNARAFVRTVRGYLKSQSRELTVNLDRLAAIEDRALRYIITKLTKYDGRARVGYSRETEAVRHAIAKLPERLQWLIAEQSLAPACRESPARLDATERHG